MLIFMAPEWALLEKWLKQLIAYQNTFQSSNSKFRLTISWKENPAIVRRGFCFMPNFNIVMFALVCFCRSQHPDYTCGGHMHTLILFPSLSKLSSQICEWHVSLHLASTCIAYGDCIMALGLSNAALPHYSNTWGKRQGAEKQTAYVKALRRPNNSSYICSPCGNRRKKWKEFSEFIKYWKLAATKELARRMNCSRSSVII